MMAATPAHVLRGWILGVLRDSPKGALRRADVLRALDAAHALDWTAEDMQSPRTRPFERKWQNNASYERASMVRDGLLTPAANGYWTLTDAGWRAAR